MDLTNSYFEDVMKLWVYAVCPLLLGTFIKLRKATASIDMCVCPSTWNNSASTGWIFMKFIWAFSKIFQENASFIKMWQV